MGRSAIAPIDPDTALRQAALQRAWDLQQAFHEVVPMSAIREGFFFNGERVSFGSFQKGIHRAKEQVGPAALSLVTAPPKPGRADAEFRHPRFPRGGDPATTCPRDSPRSRASRGAFEEFEAAA